MCNDKNLLIKLWRIYGYSLNLPPPINVSLYMADQLTRMLYCGTN